MSLIRTSFSKTEIQLVIHAYATFPYKVSFKVERKIVQLKQILCKSMFKMVCLCENYS